MPQTSRVSKNNTTIERHADGSLKRVTLHSTVVFEQGPVRSDGSRVIAISNGGWNTVTTQTRINQCFSESGLPMRYSRAKGRAVVSVAHCSNGEGTLWVDHELPPFGACLLLERGAHYTGGSWGKCTDSFVVIN